MRVLFVLIPFLIFLPVAYFNYGPVEFSKPAPMIPVAILSGAIAGGFFGLAHRYRDKKHVLWSYFFAGIAATVNVAGIILPVSLGYRAVSIFGAILGILLIIASKTEAQPTMQAQT